MTQTDIAPGLIARITQAAQYVVRGAAPDAWFGPMKPLEPLAPDSVMGRRFDYPTGYNLSTNPRSYEPVTFNDLRALADNCDILRSVIETRKDQVETLEWTIRPVTPIGGAGRGVATTDDQKRRIEAILTFLQSPDRENGFQQWLRQILEDIFVIDAASIYRRRTRGGQLYALEIVDGATIKVLLDDSGRLPAAPEPAYQQVLKGIPAVDYTREELLYLKHNPRSHKVYGYSQVEQVLTTVNILIRRSMHQLEYYREGSQPDAFLGLPKEWNQDQIVAFQKHFDAMLAGNLGLRRRLRFMPGDFSYKETKAPPLKDAYDEFLARVICFVFSVSPEPFVGQVNRATAQTSHNRAMDEGLVPLQRFVRGFLNRIIAEDFGSKDLEFVWQDGREQDAAQAAQIDVAYVNAGILTVDEVRTNLGLAPAAVAAQKKTLATGLGKFNPNHKPAGTPDGGQFTTAPDGQGDAASDAQVTGSDNDILQTWANQKTLGQHLERHGSDFDAVTQEDYVKQANDFWKRSQVEDLPKIEYPNGGEIGVYEPSTNTFGLYKADGTTMTFFKPTSPTYFEREVADISARGGKIINPLSSSAETATPAADSPVVNETISPTGSSAWQASPVQDRMIGDMMSPNGRPPVPEE